MVIGTSTFPSASDGSPTAIAGTAGTTAVSVAAGVGVAVAGRAGQAAGGGDADADAKGVAVAVPVDRGGVAVSLVASVVGVELLVVTCTSVAAAVPSHGRTTAGVAPTASDVVLATNWTAPALAAHRPARIAARTKPCIHAR